MQRPELKTLAAALSATLLLAGCAIGPDYQRPDTSLPERFGQADAAAVATRPAVAKEWWTLFQDPILNDLVAQARQYNTDLQLAVARLEEAQGLVRESHGTSIRKQIAPSTCCHPRSCVAELSS